MPSGMYRVSDHSEKKQMRCYATYSSSLQYVKEIGQDFLAGWNSLRNELMG